MESHMEESRNQKMYQMSPALESIDLSSTNRTKDNIRTHFDQVRNQYNVSN